ncbi:MAG: DUF4148 domain-containing protein [Pseudomonadota bacterium]
MNARIASAAVAIALLGSSAAAFAQQASVSGELGQTYGYSNPAPAFVSTQSRAAVRAEAARAIAAGEFTLGDDYPFQQPVVADSGVTRAQVKAELLTAIRNGTKFSDSEGG